MRIAPLAAPGAAAPSSVAAPTGPSEQQQLLIERMSSASTIAHIDRLDEAPRTWRSPAYQKAAEYVVAQLQAAGWDARIEEQKSRWGNDTLKNVVAERRGTAPDGERKLVIAGAHLDSVGRSPGANDNATGSATLIELARSFQGIDTANDIRLVWFDGEEAGLLGSNAYVAAHKDEMPRVVGMVNMDMVGSPRGDVGFSLGTKTSPAVGQALKGVAELAGVAGVLRSERHNRSDHASFDRAGVPSIDFGVSVKTIDRDDPNYHSPRDTIDKLNPQVLEGYGDLIAVTLLDLANRSERIPGAAGDGMERFAVGR